MKRLLRSSIGAICSIAMAATGLGAVAQSAYAADAYITIKNVNEDDVFEAYRIFELPTEGSRTDNQGYQYAENPDYIGYLLWAIPGTEKTDVWQCTTTSGTTTTNTDAIDNCSGANQTITLKGTAADRLKTVYDYIRSLDQQDESGTTATSGRDCITDPSSQTHAYFTTVFAKIQQAELPADITNIEAEADADASSTTKFKAVLEGTAGYYLIHQTEGTDSYNLILADTSSSTADEAVVEPKKASLLFEKKIKDYDTSAIGNGVTTKENGTAAGLITGWQDSADASLISYAVGWNDTRAADSWPLPIRLQATLPSDVASYDSYRLVFHDLMSNAFQNVGGTLYFYNIRVYAGDVTYENAPMNSSSTANSYFEDENLIEGWSLESIAASYTSLVDGPTNSNSATSWTYDETKTSSTPRPAVTADKASLLRTTTVSDTDETRVFTDTNEKFAIGFEDLTTATYKNDSTDPDAEDAHEAGDTVTLLPGMKITVIIEMPVSYGARQYSDATREGAVHGSYGNTNTAYVEYSTDPASSLKNGAQLNTLEDNDESESSAISSNVVGYSVSDSIRVFMYGLNVEKVDKNNNPLEGAKFTLYQFIADDDERIGVREKSTANNGNGWSTEVAWSQEKVTETVDGVSTTVSYPYGYLAKGQQIVMKTDGSQYVVDAGTEVSATDGTVVFVAPANGWWKNVFDGENISANLVSGSNKYIASFNGLGDGLYRLTEVQAPAGYDAANDIDFEIAADHDVLSEDPQLNSMGVNASSQYAKSDVSQFSTQSVQVKTGEDEDGADVTVESKNAVLAVAIQNTGGWRLPSTGGMGTIMLYTIGGLMILITIMGIAYSLRKQQQA